jgi:hypothetical protein
LNGRRIGKPSRSSMPQPSTRCTTAAALLLLVLMAALCSCCDAAASISAEAVSSGGTGEQAAAERDLQVLVPESVKGRRNVHIRILLQEEELFRGSLAAVKAGDFNFTVPDRVLRGGKCTLVVDFFIPPSETSVAQSAIEVEGVSGDRFKWQVVSATQIGQISAAAGSAAVLGLGARQAFRNAGVRRGELPQVVESRSPPFPPPAPAFPPPPATVTATTLERPFITPPPAPRGSMDQVRSTPPMPLITPKIVKSAFKQCMQQEFLSNQLASIGNNKVASAAIGAVLLSPATSRVFRLMHKEKIRTSPVTAIEVVDKYFDRAGSILDHALSRALSLLRGTEGRRP